MAQRKPTPEEQLLKLIENSESGNSSQKVASETKTKPAKPKKGFLSGFFSKAKTESSKVEVEETRPAASFSFQIKAVNNILIALVLAAGIYLILDLFVLKADQAEFLSQVGTTDPVYPILGAEYEEASQDVDYYQQPLQRRNPFLSSSVEVIQDTAGGGGTFTAISNEPSESLADVLSGFTLVGISWGADRPLAMVEDTATGRTHFLREGQELQSVKIQKITKEKVIVTYEGEEGVLF